MSLLFIYLPAKNQEGELVEHTAIDMHEREHYPNEGSEFVDDAIRMNDQPFMYSEESAGAINYDDLYDYSAE